MIRLLRRLSLLMLAAALILTVVAWWVGRRDGQDTAPTITADSRTLELSCQYTSDQLMEGIHARDAQDGDLTAEVMVGGFSPFVQPGLCELDYVVYDSALQMATLTRQVRFTDYHPPRFSLSAGLCFAKSTASRAEAEQLFTAADLLEGDLTDWITFGESTVCFQAEGEYTLYAEVSNSLGDTVGYDFPVHVYDQDAQQLTISLNQSLVYLTKGDPIHPATYISSVTDRYGNRYDPGQVDISSQVDSSRPGLYQIHYTIQAARPAAQEQTGQQSAATPRPVTTAAPQLSTLAGLQLLPQATSLPVSTPLPEKTESDLLGETWLTVIVEEASP